MCFHQCFFIFGSKEFFWYEHNFIIINERTSSTRKKKYSNIFYLFFDSKFTFILLLIMPCWLWIWRWTNNDMYLTTSFSMSTLNMKKSILLLSFVTLSLKQETRLYKNKEITQLEIYFIYFSILNLLDTTCILLYRSLYWLWIWRVFRGLDFPPNPKIKTIKFWAIDGKKI